MPQIEKCPYPDEQGIVYSGAAGRRPFSVARVEDYVPVVGEQTIERLVTIASKLKGMTLLELNSSAKGGGVAEMLFSSIPLLDQLGINVEWMVIGGSADYFKATKTLHNLLQGMPGTFTPSMEQTYLSSIEQCACEREGSCGHEVVLVHDPQPFGLGHYLRSKQQSWLWRCHIDIDEDTIQRNPRLWAFMTGWTDDYDAAMFSAAHYVVSRWPLPKFIIPPFIDPLSEKNRELSASEIESVLSKYGLDPAVPMVLQVGRFDPWKGIDRTIDSFVQARKEAVCQLVIAGGLAADDPEGQRVLDEVRERAAGQPDVHILELSLDDRSSNWMEVNALQRAATVVMQPSTREGFGLVITEALWKGKPVIAADVGAIPLQIRGGATGFFYGGVGSTARRIVSLLNDPGLREKVGQHGREYVREHFLMPARVADELQAMLLAREGVLRSPACADCIISFHPWFKLSKRGRG
jgi:trehalose synthase